MATGGNVGTVTKVVSELRQPSHAPARDLLTMYQLGWHATLRVVRTGDAREVNW